MSWTSNCKESGWNRDKDVELEAGAGNVKSESLEDVSDVLEAHSSWLSLCMCKEPEFDELKMNFNSDIWSDTQDNILRHTKLDVPWAN